MAMLCAHALREDGTSSLIGRHFISMPDLIDFAMPLSIITSDMLDVTLQLF